MTTYVTEAELLARHNVFSANSGSNVCSDFIYYAEREVEARLASKYAVPFAAAHPTVKDLVITACWVRHNKERDAKNGPKIAEMFDARIDRILDGTEYIITGSGHLAPGAVSDADVPFSTTEDYHPTHSMLGAESGSTRVDSAWQQDLEDERL